MAGLTREEYRFKLSGFEPPHRTKLCELRLDSRLSLHVQNLKKAIYVCGSKSNLVKIMPYANNHGVRVHYEVEGNGPPLVLLHGSHQNLEVWRESGYVEALKNNYQLILIDMRGRGASDKPHNPEAYELKLLVEDIMAVLDDLGVHKSHFLGYSMGGGIGFGIAKYAPERFHSLIIGGAHPYEPNADELAEIDTDIQLWKKGTNAAIAAYEKQLGPKLTPKMKARLAAIDPEAIVAMMSSKDLTRSLEDVLPTMRMPCLVYAGEADSYAFLGAKKCVKSMPNATFISLPSLDHTEAQYQSNVILPYITKFLAKISQS